MKLCLICGKSFAQLGKHLHLHNISSEEYHLKYELKLEEPPKCEYPGCSNSRLWSGELWRGYYSGCCRNHGYSVGIRKTLKKLKDEIDENGVSTYTRKFQKARRTQYLNQLEINPETGNTFATDIAKKIYKNMNSESKERFLNGGRKHLKKLINEWKLNGVFSKIQTKRSHSYWKNLTSEEKDLRIKENLSRMYSRYKLEYNGKVFDNLQGYEGQAIKYLIDDENINPDNIEVKSMTFIKEDGRLYFPDLKVQNTIIEVKSSFTIKNYETPESIKKKANSVLIKGFNFTILIMNSDGTLNERIDYCNSLE